MNSKKYISIFLICMMVITMNTVVYGESQSQGVTVADSPIGNIESKSLILMEGSTGKILYGYNEHQKLKPASVTKIMTLLLIMEAVDSKKIKLSDTVTVSPHAASMGGSQVYLEPGEQLTVEEMIKCVGIQSGNDAAVALGEHIAGSEPAFVELMNKKAKELGMKNTTFKNACGLDAPGHETTAYDISLMSKELIHHHPSIVKYITIWQDQIIHKTKKGDKPFGLSNTNKMLKWYSNAQVLGVKTGFTQEAGYCFSGAAQKDGMTLIAVNMGHPDLKRRFHEVMKLFDWGFAKYSIAEGEKLGTIKEKVKVVKGAGLEVNAVIKQNYKILLNKETKNQLQSKVEIIDHELMAPVKKGEVLGQLIYSVGGKEVGRVDLVADRTVEKVTYTKTYRTFINKVFNIQ